MKEKLSNDFPWVTFKIHKNMYSVNSQYVNAIIPLAEDITPIPEAAEYVRGVVQYQGEMIKIIDMRDLLQVESVEEEYQEFQKMLEQRRQDHVHWVNVLEESAQNATPFHLATDPHKCAFGIWYDNFHSDINSINFHLGRIEEPHRLLHETAEEIIKCSRNCDECERKECLRDTLAKAKEEYMPEILELLEEAKDVFKEHFKEMIIIVKCQNQTFGFSVDEVLAVEELIFLNDKEDHITQTFKTNLVTNVAKTRQSNELILLLNLEALLTVFEE